MKQKILILRFSSIGDIVLTSPIVRGLAKAGNYEIHFLLKEKFLDVVANNPYISKVYTFQKETNEVINDLKAENYDLIIDLHRNLRSTKLKLQLGIKSTTFHKLNLKKWLMVNFKINLLPEVHIVNRYFQAVKKLGIQYDGQGLDYFSGITETATWALLPVHFQKGFMAFVVGGAHATKQIPIELAEKIFTKTTLPIVLLGGPGDMAKAAELEKLYKERVFNGCGKFTLNQSAAIISISSKVITGDTGLMHIAAAYRRQIHSFWGNTIPEFGMYPFLPSELENLSIIHQISHLKCRPCSKIGYNECPKKHFDCMKKIDLTHSL